MAQALLAFHASRSAKLALRRGALPVFLPACQRAFTLIELMIVVLIIAILATIALPVYNDYVLRARLTDGTEALMAMRGQMELYYQDNRTYAAFTNTTGATIQPPCQPLTGQTTAVKAGTFTVSCATDGDTAPTATTYTVTATGSGPTAGFTYTINEQEVQATTAMPSKWGTLPVPCDAWITRKGQSCS